MSTTKKLLFLIGDIIVLYVSLAFTLAVRYQSWYFVESLKNHIIPFSIIFVFWILIFLISDLYRSKTLRNRSTLLGTLIVSIVVANVVSVVVFYLFIDTFFGLTPKTNLALFSIVFFFLDAGVRMFLLKIVNTGAIPFVIIGDSSLIRETIDYFTSEAHPGYRFVRWIKNMSDVSQDELCHIIAAGKATIVIFQPHLAKDSSHIGTLYQLLPFGVELVSFPDFYEMIFEKVPLEEVREDWFLENVSTRRRLYDTAKRVIDFFLAVAMGIIFLPFIFVIAIGIKLSSAGSVLYIQTRRGKNGMPFILYKFRTMTDGNNGPLWTETHDERITRFGAFLRFTHIDEIPQLWNVLRGDISFTGPRPERVELAKTFERFPYYEIRHVVKPGITGWAQINYRPSASLEEAYEKLKYDIFYVKNRSFLLDIMIILKTIKYVFTRL